MADRWPGNFADVIVCCLALEIRVDPRWCRHGRCLFLERCLVHLGRPPISQRSSSIGPFELVVGRRWHGRQPRFSGKMRKTPTTRWPNPSESCPIRCSVHNRCVVCPGLERNLVRLGCPLRVQPSSTITLQICRSSDRTRTPLDFGCRLSRPRGRGVGWNRIVCQCLGASGGQLCDQRFYGQGRYKAIQGSGWKTGRTILESQKPECRPCHCCAQLPHTGIFNNDSKKFSEDKYDSAAIHSRTISLNCELNSFQSMVCFS